MLLNLKLALLSRHLHQSDLAYALKVSPNVISEVVRGRRTLAPYQVERVAELLQADPVWLFQEASYVPPPRSSTVQEPDTAAPAMACASADGH